jgi:hypothetical protein
MKKVLLIGVAVIGIVAVFLLMRETKSEAALEASSPAVSPGFDAIEKASPIPDTSLSRRSDVKAEQSTRLSRIPLPSPALPELTKNLVPIHLYPLFGWKDIGGYVPRRRMVEALGDALSADEITVLILFARSKPADVGLSDSDFNGVGDVVLLKLEAQKSLRPDYTDHLVVMFYDESLNAQWRDYCIQHIGTVYQRTPEEKRPVIRQLYEDTLKPGSTFAGTTLLSMKRSAGTADLSREFTAKQAMAVASSDAFGDAERLSGLAVAAEFNAPEAVGFAREVAVSKRSAIFRMAALAVIGQRGDVSDQPLLEKYSKSSDIRLRTAATEALKKLSMRTQD